MKRNAPLWLTAFKAKLLSDMDAERDHLTPEPNALEKTQRFEYGEKCDRI